MAARIDRQLKRSSRFTNREVGAVAGEVAGVLLAGELLAGLAFGAAAVEEPVDGEIMLAADAELAVTVKVRVTATVPGQRAPLAVPM